MQQTESRRLRFGAFSTPLPELRAATPLDRVGGQLAVRVSTRLTAPADVLPAINETRANQGPSENDLELSARMLAHLAVGVREDELGWRLLGSPAQHGHDAFSHRNH